MKQIRAPELLIMRAKALVIGCSGQDGSYLIKYLLSKNYDVIGTSRFHRRSYPNHDVLKINDKFVIKEIDPTNLDSLKKLFLKENPDQIYNFSAQSSVGFSFVNPIETQKSIAEVTVNILEACREIDFKGKVFFAGSSEVYGVTKIPATINSVINPQSPYGIAKVESMLLVKLYREIYNLNVITGVLFPHESPLRSKNFITHKIINGAIECSKNKHHKIHIGNLNIERDWGWAEEFIEGIHLMITSDLQKDQIICTGKSTKLSEFIEKSFKKLNLNWKDHIVIEKRLFRGKDISKSVGDPRKMFEELNWRANIKIDDIIEKLINSKLILR